MKLPKDVVRVEDLLPHYLTMECYRTAPEKLDVRLIATGASSDPINIPVANALRLDDFRLGYIAPDQIVTLHHKSPPEKEN